jgi:hypothetical protein
VRGGVAGAQVADRADGDRPAGQAPGDVAEQALFAGIPPVDLVDEDQRGHVEPAQRPHEHAGLRLHALDRRDDEHGPVEHAQRPLHLGDEVGVAGRVDQVDRGVADRERGHGGLDGDAAAALEGERVGLGAAGVDTADGVDDPADVEEALGQTRLTGIDVRHDAEVENGHAGPSRKRWSGAPGTRNLPASLLLRRLPEPRNLPEVRGPRLRLTPLPHRTTCATVVITA